jgi:hypothetical protein
MSTSNNAHPGLQKAERAVADAESADAKANELVASLQQRLAAHDELGAQLTAERSSISFKVHGDGDPKARERLTEINNKLIVHASERESLIAALKESEVRREAAKAAVVREAQKVRAEKLRVLSRVFTTHMRKLDQHLNAFADELDNVEDIREQLGALGVGPTFEQLVVLGERPVNVVLSQSIFENRIGRHLPPHERMSFGQLAQAWTKPHEIEIARILGNEPNEDSEAA